MAEMPPLEEFSHLTEAQSAARFAESQNHIVYRTLIADTQTAVGAMMKLADGQDYHCLLESVEGGEVRGRYSVIGLKPDLLWRCSGNKVEINRQAETDLTAFLPDDKLPLVSLRALMKESEMPNTAPLPPMASGLFGYFGYDMIRHVEKVPDDNPDTLGVFDTVLMRPSVIAIFDRLKDSITLAVPIRPASWKSPAEAWHNAQSRLDETEERLYDAIPHSGEHSADMPDIMPESNVSQNRFYEMVKKARDYISAGDIFQVVLSQRFSFPFTLPTFTFYRSLRRLNPSPFLFHFTLGDVSIVGSSPEILVRLRGGEVTIRPIAGTRPRGATPEEDAAHAADLMADVKERSEHLMLLDLGRNDVGRVSKPGSVRVISNFDVEYYSHVMHIASEVRGQIRDECDVIDALIAGFPAGTVSGAPKIRAMEIIDELEPNRRGIYAGAVGYISAAGELDSCIALRTAIIKDGMMHVQAGAGIVYDSQEKSEFDECHNKARALIRAAMDASQISPSNRR